MLASSLLRGSLQKSVSSFVSRNLSASGAVMANKKVAVVLSGCGVFDGSEVHESAAALAALTRNNIEPVICAPTTQQAHVVIHDLGVESKGEQRNVQSEAARIARGKVIDLKDINVKDMDAIVFPGGFGAAKNLSDFAFKGTEMTVKEDVARLLKEFRAENKPIGLCCISPILAAKVFGDKGIKLTLGCGGDEKLWPFAGAIDAAKSFGANVVEMSVSEVCIDSDLKVLTTPAYMYAGKFHEIQDGVTKWINALVEMM